MQILYYKSMEKVKSTIEIFFKNSNMEKKVCNPIYFTIQTLEISERKIKSELRKKFTISLFSWQKLHEIKKIP